MRDYIVIRQKAFYEYLQNYNKNKTKKEQIWLDLKDIAIFDYIAQFCLSDNEKIKSSRIMVGDKEYTHIAYKKIIEDNPFLDISSKRHILRIINKLEKLGLIYKYFSKEKGNKTYFTLGHTGHTLTTSMSQLLGHTGRNPSDTDVRSLRTSMSDNSNINIENNNRENKNRESIYIGSLSFFERTLLRVISNLQDLFGKYNLPAYKEKEYFNAYRKPLKQGYTEHQILLAIYARVDKALVEDVDEFKFLETLSNPKYFVKSIEQLILEANSRVKTDMELYEKSQIEIENELGVKFLGHCYSYYMQVRYKNLIDSYGYFEDCNGESWNIEDTEYHFYLMKKFLAKYEINIVDKIREFIIGNSIENISYSILMSKFLFGLINFKDEVGYLESYSSTKGLSELYNKVLSGLEIEHNLNEIVSQLESQLVVE